MTTKTLAGPRIKTALPGPNAKRVLAGDEKYISPSYTRSYPLVAKSGRGIVVTDVDGNEFFDFSAGIAVTSTGHCHPDVVAAIQKQAGELIHMSGTDFYYESMITLAERLSKIAPMPGPHRIYYGNSGAEAVEAALKLARYHTKRQNVIAFFGAFHGRTMGALSLTASKPQQKRRFGTGRSGRDSRALSRRLSRLRRRRAGCRGVRARLCALHRRQAVQDDSGSGRSGGHFRRAGAGRGRLRSRAHGLHAGAAPHLRQVRHSAGGGRSPKRRRPHRQVVGHRAHRSAARYRLHGEGNCFRHAARHHDEPRRHHGLGARLARVHFWRQSGLHRGCAGHARRDREGRPAARTPPRSATTC